jgi:predicted kinase
MNKEQAIQILEHALNQAAQKGAFNLIEANQVLQALQLIKTTEEKK